MPAITMNTGVADILTVMRRAGADPGRAAKMGKPAVRGAANDLRRAADNRHNVLTYHKN